MNPHTGEIHDLSEFFDGDKPISDRVKVNSDNSVSLDGVRLEPIPREKLSEVTNMNETQRKAWAKQERKRALRLAQGAPCK